MPTVLVQAKLGCSFGLLDFGHSALGVRLCYTLGCQILFLFVNQKHCYIWGSMQVDRSTGYPLVPMTIVDHRRQEDTYSETGSYRHLQECPGADIVYTAPHRKMYSPGQYRTQQIAPERMHIGCYTQDTMDSDTHMT